MGAAAERAPDVLGQHADVGPLAAADGHRQTRRPRTRRGRARRSVIGLRRVGRPSARRARTRTAARPSRLSAEYIGGTCAISPRSPASTLLDLRASRDHDFTALDHLPFGVAGRRRRPERDRRGVGLVRVEQLPPNFVASPNSTGSRPVASGSSVPVCPAFAARYSRCAAWSAAFEVTPAGLSSSSTPVDRAPPGAFATAFMPQRRPP